MAPMPVMPSELIGGRLHATATVAPFRYDYSVHQFNSKTVIHPIRVLFAYR